jgi:hypothetical protein
VIIFQTDIVLQNCGFVMCILNLLSEQRV